MEKRGISAIVATVLIILITVAAVTILWAVVIPMIDTQLTLAEECRKAQTAIRIESSCSTLQNMSAIVTRTSEDFNLVDLQFGGSNNKGNTPAVYLVTHMGFPDALLNKVNEKRNYSANISHMVDPATMATIISLRVAPVVKYKNTEKICDPSPKVSVPWCNETWNALAPKQGL